MFEAKNVSRSTVLCTNIGNLIITLYNCNFIISACKTQVPYRFVWPSWFLRGSQLQSCKIENGWSRAKLMTSFCYENFSNFFLQKFANLQNFILCLISPRWKLSFDIHEAIVILDQFQKAILDEPEADLSDLEIDYNWVNEGCVIIKNNFPSSLMPVIL